MNQSDSILKRSLSSKSNISFSNIHSFSQLQMLFNEGKLILKTHPHYFDVYYLIIVFVLQKGDDLKLTDDIYIEWKKELKGDLYSSHWKMGKNSLLYLEEWITFKCESIRKIPISVLTIDQVLFCEILLELYCFYQEENKFVEVYRNIFEKLKEEINETQLKQHIGVPINMNRPRMKRSTLKVRKSSVIQHGNMLTILTNYDDDENEEENDECSETSEQIDNKYVIDELVKKDYDKDDDTFQMECLNEVKNQLNLCQRDLNINNIEESKLHAEAIVIYLRNLIKMQQQTITTINNHNSNFLK